MKIYKENILGKVCFILLTACIILWGCSKSVKLLSIEITTQPDKKEYILGEKFDPTGMVVTATYDDNSTKRVIVTDGMLEYDFSTAGENKKVVITYENKAAIVANVTVFHPDDPILNYLGKWNDKEGFTSFEIFYNELRVYRKSTVVDDEWFNVSPITWGIETNQNFTLKDDYPSGYEIAGPIFKSSHSFLYPVGKLFGYDAAFFLHKEDTDSMIFAPLDSWNIYSVYFLSKEK
jgi:hypothetical protein